jgi:hypothetical protein
MKLIGHALICSMLCSTTALAQSSDHHYGLRYDVTFKPAEDRAEITLTLDRRIKGNLTWMAFRIDPQRHQGFSGDGTVAADGPIVKWTPPETGGKLSFHVPVNHERPNGRFDARMTEDWAIFRGDDIFPPAETLDHELSEADAALHVHLPERWSFVSAYPSIDKNVFDIEHAHRRFDRPTGWMAAGRLGVRRDRIANVHVVVAGPLGQGVRRLDIMALMNWNLPRVRRLVPDHMPKRLVIVSAGDPMWRGGLSGPNSLYIHADRPLLSENGSSTLVHELIHVATRIEGEPGADWIVEGMAEYYSLKILWRSGTLTDQRYKQTFAKLAQWAKESGPLDAETSRGPTTARAVGIMRELDREIYKRTDHEKSLDDVVRLLTAAQRKVSLASFRQAVVEVMGEPAETLSDDTLDLGRDAGTPLQK